MIVRRAEIADRHGIWQILEPVIRAGETYTLPRDLSQNEALAYWFSEGHEVWVADDGGTLLGTYYLKANQGGGGSHVANCGYMTARESEGRGVARSMCVHSLDRARERGFRAMQFNFVVSTNERAVRLWQNFGFEIVGRIPEGFADPSKGYVDAFVMYRSL